MEEKLKIFFCEDDENLGMLLREYLQAKGYITDLFSDGDAGYKGFIKSKYDLCVLDVMMPKKDGFTLAQEIRSINPDIPIIFLTAKTMKEDILEGFKIGADDYLTKPFSMEELLLRIEAILRRVKGKKMKDIPFYKLGDFFFDTQKQTLSIGDKVTKLTTKECELLSLLCAHANEILERNYALKTIWVDDNYFNARSMDVYITKLRKLLKDDPKIEIINIHGKGYKLITPSGEEQAREEVYFFISGKGCWTPADNSATEIRIFSFSLQNLAGRQLITIRYCAPDNLPVSRALYSEGDMPS